MFDFNIIIPYSRLHFLKNSYLSVTGELLELFESEIFPYFIEKIITIERLSRLTIYSNDASVIRLPLSRKITIVNRKPLSEELSRREDLIGEIKENIKSEDFLIINPMFPLLRTDTIIKFFDQFEKSENNLFLGTTGLSRQYLSEDKGGNQLDKVHYDFGAINGIKTDHSNKCWSSFNEFNSAELLTIRSLNDFILIKTIRKMGFGS